MRQNIYTTSFALIRKALPAMALFLFCLQANAQTELWGMTQLGGASNVGAIFKTDANGNNHTVLAGFPHVDATSPYYTQLITASNGMMYGMTERGGSSDAGTIFQYDPATNTYIKKFNFTGTATGQLPRGSLAQAADGMLYGLTYSGGTGNRGVLFQFNPATNVYTKKIDFVAATTGSYPNGSLMQATNGKLYGFCGEGGTSAKGTLFEYDPATSTLTKKIDFDGAALGAFPYGSLLQATDGFLYGTTGGGGALDEGTIFQFNIATGTLTKKSEFDYTTGSGPLNSLMQASDGMLYGTTACCISSTR